MELPTARMLLSGGGVSRVFNLPPWQAEEGVAIKTGASGRAVPDVASKADRRNGYRIHVGGQAIGMGGTSAAAPLWAGLIARFNRALEGSGRRVGHLNPLLYHPNLRAGLHDISSGRGGLYKPCKGWDPCTGLGSPRGTTLLAALQAILHASS
jgi:kumamolisin